ncbi:hypothetical protein BC940DRAFT_292375 [Gongronella butleri]|nr:hypothetical protein BC940DRAFT_292375 [Gongronella butleri]
MTTCWLARWISSRRRVTVCLVTLAAAMFTMLYIFTAFLASFNEQTATPFAPRPSSMAPASSRVANHDTERFLAYLPHSGLSNQRIELENALLMASVLNRTLLIPPALLGNVIGWNGHDHLAKVLSWLTTPRDFDAQCPERPDRAHLASYVKTSRCQAFHGVGTLAWSHWHDLAALDREKIRFREVTTVNLDVLRKELELSEHDVDVHHDSVRYDWYLYEDKHVRDDLLASQTNFVKGAYGRHEYYRVLDWDFWHRDARLLYLGSVFGSSRLHLTDPHHLALREHIKRALIYRLDTPLGETVRNIINDIFKTAPFHAIHIRAEDKKFTKVLQQQIDQSVHQVAATLALIDNDKAKKTSPAFCAHAPPHWNQKAGDNDRDDDDDDDEKDDDDGHDLIHQQKKLKAGNQEKQKKLGDDDAPMVQRPPAMGLQQRSSPGDNDNDNDDDDDDDDDENRENTATMAVNMYMATDYRHPRQRNGPLAPWFDRYPCTLTLEDVPDAYFDPLDAVHDLIHPKKKLKKFLFPLVDAMLAAHGNRVFLTPKSTFSKYIGELHDAWTTDDT